jgi:hypothetical protein
VVLFKPEPCQWGSGSFVLRGGGGSRKMAVALLSVHTTAKNPHPISGMQAYILILLVGKFSDVRLYALSEVLQSPGSMQQGSLCVVLEISGLFCVLRLLAVFLSAFRHIALVKE